MQTTTDDGAGKMNGNKEPWLAVSLSWLLPGLGHLYCGLWLVGIALIFLRLLLAVAGTAGLMASKVPIAAILAIATGSLVLSIGSSVAAFRTVKSSNAEDFESHRAQCKDPWLAVFLSLVLPGLGHLYLRKWATGAVLTVAYLGLRLAASNTPAVVVVTGLGGLVPFLAYFGSPTVRRQSRHPLIAFAVVYIAVVWLGGTLATVALRVYVMQVTRATSASMFPTLRKGTRMVVDELCYRWQEPAVGDIVVFTPPDHPLVTSARPAVKRIVATGGQTVQVRSGFVWIDGQYSEPRGTPRDYIATHFRPAPNKQADYFAYGVTEPYHVPGGCYFVLGDNRANSFDSRGYGAVPRERITGRVVRVLWPLSAPPLYDEESR